jgi:hypothetical protein
VVLQQNLSPSRPHPRRTSASVHAENWLLAVVCAEAGDGSEEQLLQLAAAAPRHDDGNCSQLISGAAEDAANGV